jgi:hypothetical protein
MFDDRDIHTDEITALKVRVMDSDIRSTAACRCRFGGRGCSFF